MPVTDYEIIIGLEVHVELKTVSKLFCNCATKFGAPPNSQVCPVCLGLPGTLPVLNEQALDYAILAGLALNCRIADFSRFDRKQYFYPDLPKAYQITQSDLPLCRDGWIDIPAEERVGKVKRVGIIRVHLEEEAGKTVHSGGGILNSHYALLDYNRCGIPLIEIVSAPELRSPREARSYLERLKTLLHYTGVSDCKMEEGSLRCDANISLRPPGRTELGIPVEIKNMNSFRAVQAALEYEAARQAQLLDSGARLNKETRAWDENRSITVFMRSKEDCSDYRFFPEPDLLPVWVDKARVERLRHSLPELPEARRSRYIGQWGLPEEDADLLSSHRELAEFFEAAVAHYGGAAKTVSNWVKGELFRMMHQQRVAVSALKLQPAQLAKLLQLIDDNLISGKIAKAVFETMFCSGKDPGVIIKEKGLAQINNIGELRAVVQKVLKSNQQSVAAYRSGKEQAFRFLVGRIMKETQGRANPSLVNELLREELFK